MAEAILLTVLTVLAVIGITDLIHSLVGWMLSGGKRQYLISVIPCTREEENPEYTVKSICSQIREECHCKGHRIVLVDCGMTPKAKQTCTLLCNEMEEVLLLNKEEIDTLLQEKFCLQITP